MIKKLNNFFSKDIRWKLKTLSKKFKINFYPVFFSFKGLRGYYEKIIFNLILKDKFYKKKMLIKKNIFISCYNQNNKINCLVSSPGSGSNYIRCLLSSYFEIYYKIGNGIPKFSNIHNKFIFAASPILSSDLWNAINLDEGQIFDNDNLKKFLPIKEFHEKKIFFSRYPFSDQDLFEWKNSRSVILTRDPFDWLISYYSHHENSEFINTDLIDEKLVNVSLSKLKNYFYFWTNYILKNKNFEFLIIDYKEIIKSPKKEFLRICNFFEYDTSNDSLIERCIEFNSKEFAFKNLNVNFHGTRFTDDKRKMIVKNKIDNYLSNKIKNLNLNNDFEKLLNIKSNKI